MAYGTDSRAPRSSSRASCDTGGLPQAPNWLVGLWRRESIELRDGTFDRMTGVFWGQTRNLFVDLRIPANRPASLGRRGFEDFTLEELGRIAERCQLSSKLRSASSGRFWLERTFPRLFRPTANTASASAPRASEMLSRRLASAAKGCPDRK